MRCARVEIGGRKRRVVWCELVDEGDRVGLMEKGGDVNGDENID